MPNPGDYCWLCGVVRDEHADAGHELVPFPPDGYEAADVRPGGPGVAPEPGPDGPCTGRCDKGHCDCPLNDAPWSAPTQSPEEAPR